MLKRGSMPREFAILGSSYAGLAQAGMRLPENSETREAKTYE
jgi:hypothetical protein